MRRETLNTIYDDILNEIGSDRTYTLAIGDGYILMLLIKWSENFAQATLITQELDQGLVLVRIERDSMDSLREALLQAKEPLRQLLDARKALRSLNDHNQGIMERIENDATIIECKLCGKHYRANDLNYDKNHDMYACHDCVEKLM